MTLFYILKNMNLIKKSVLIVLLVLPSFVFSRELISHSGLFVCAQDSLGSTTNIFASVIVKKDPTNEASIVSVDGQYKIYYINRPGLADKMISEASKGGVHWNDSITDSAVAKSE